MTNPVSKLVPSTWLAPVSKNGFVFSVDGNGLLGSSGGVGGAGGFGSSPLSAVSPSTVTFPFPCISILYPSTTTVSGKLSILLVSEIGWPWYISSGMFFFKLLLSSFKFNFPLLS